MLRAETSSSASCAAPGPAVGSARAWSRPDHDRAEADVDLHALLRALRSGLLTFRSPRSHLPPGSTPGVCRASDCNSCAHAALLHSGRIGQGLGRCASAVDATAIRGAPVAGRAREWWSASALPAARAARSAAATPSRCAGGPNRPARVRRSAGSRRAARTPDRSSPDRRLAPGLRPAAGAGRTSGPARRSPAVGRSPAAFRHATQGTSVYRDPRADDGSACWARSRRARGSARPSMETSRRLARAPRHRWRARGRPRCKPPGAS